MRQSTRHRTLPALALVLAVGIAAAGCATATAGTASDSHTAAASVSATARVFGPYGPDQACAAALKAEQTLQARQGKDQDSESALDKDFTNFANALSAAAQRETHPATAKAMTALANDYNALVQSQSGAEQLPDMNTVENDGTAFDKACSLCHNYARCAASSRFPGRMAGPESGSPVRWCRWFR
jgi:hypothetical protein